MDPTVRDIALAAMTTLAALGGVWLAGNVTVRHRHDDAKRDAYAAFLAHVRDAEASLRVHADKPERSQPVSDDWASDVLNAYSVIQITGSHDSVAKAKTLVSALVASSRPWMADKSDEIDAERSAKSDHLRSALADFVLAARRDLNAHD
jgi:hypothetical protein